MIWQVIIGAVFLVCLTESRRHGLWWTCFRLRDLKIFGFSILKSGSVNISCLISCSLSEVQ